MPSNVCLGYKYHGSRIILILGNYSSRKSAHGILNLGQKPHDKKPPNKSPPTISPRYKKIGAGFFFRIGGPQSEQVSINGIFFNNLFNNPRGFIAGGLLFGGHFVGGF